MMTIALTLWAFAAPASAQVRPETRMRSTGSGLVLGGSALGAAAVLSGVLIDGRRSDWDRFQGQLYLTAPMAVGGLGLVAAGAAMHVRAGHVELATAPMPMQDGAGVTVGGRF